MLRFSKNISVDGRSAEASGRISLQDKANLDNEVQASGPNSGSITYAKGIEAHIPNDNQPNLCSNVVACISEAYIFDG